MNQGTTYHRKIMKKEILGGKVLELMAKRWPGQRGNFIRRHRSENLKHP